MRAAAVAVPLYSALTSTETATDVTAGPACLAWFGNKEDGNCLSYSNGSGVSIGSPAIGFGEDGFGVYRHVQEQRGILKSEIDDAPTAAIRQKKKKAGRKSRSSAAASDNVEEDDDEEDEDYDA